MEPELVGHLNGEGGVFKYLYIKWADLEMGGGLFKFMLIVWGVLTFSSAGGKGSGLALDLIIKSG